MSRLSIIALSFLTLSLFGAGCSSSHSWSSSDFSSDANTRRSIGFGPGLSSSMGTKGDAASSTIPLIDSTNSVYPRESTQAIPSRYLVLEGVLPEIATTTLSLTIHAERISGNYQSAASHGFIYGMMATSTGVWEIGLSPGNVDIVALTGTFQEGAGTFLGTATLYGEDAITPVKLFPANKVESAALSFKKISHHWVKREGVECRVDMEYPQIAANETVSKVSADRINQAIRRYIGETPTSTMSDLVEYPYNDCLETQKSLDENRSVDDLPASFDDAARMYTYELTTNITRNERGLLSIEYVDYSYTGGAHGNGYLMSQTFDLSTGKELKIRDLVRAEGLETWIRREQQALLKQLDSESEGGVFLFDEQKEQAEQVASGRLKGDAASSTPAYYSIDQWYISGNSLIRYYQSYEIAAYAAGQPTVDLPFQTWKDLATPGTDRWFR